MHARALRVPHTVGNVALGRRRTCRPPRGVAQGRCWVEGDNPEDSGDSRTMYGPVRAADGHLTCAPACPPAHACRERLCQVHALPLRFQLWGRAGRVSRAARRTGGSSCKSTKWTILQHPVTRRAPPPRVLLVCFWQRLTGAVRPGGACMLLVLLLQVHLGLLEGRVTHVVWPPWRIQAVPRVCDRDKLVWEHERPADERA